MSQLNTNTDKLKELLNITDNLPKPGANLSDATATAKDVAIGKIAYGASGRFEGELEESKAASTLSMTDSTPTITGTNLVLNYTHSSDRIMRTNSASEIKTPLSNLGNASPSQVLSSATFTSANSGGIAKSGSIATKTSSDLQVSGATVTVPTGYYASDYTKSVATANRANTIINTNIDQTNKTLTFTAVNNQSTGYVTGSNSQVTKSVILSTDLSTGQIVTKVNMSDSDSFISETIDTGGVTIIPKSPNATYGFKIQSDGYYRNENSDPDTASSSSNRNQYKNTMAIARILYNFNTATDLYIKTTVCGESKYDFGIVSKVNTEIPATYNSSNTAYLELLKSSSSGTATEKIVPYNSLTGTGFIDIAYRKDSSNSYGTDDLKFQVYVGSVPGSSSNPNIVDTTITDTAATATSADILSGKKAYINGQLVEGNIAKKTSSNVTVSGNTVTIPAGYYASQVTKTVSGSSVSQGTVVLGPPSTDYNMGYVYSTNTYVTINYTSTKPTYNSSTQTLSLSRTSSLKLSSSSTADSVKSTLSGKYITITSNASMSMGSFGGGTTSTTTSEIFYVPSSATFNVTENTSGSGSFAVTYYAWSASGLQLCNAYYST